MQTEEIVKLTQKNIKRLLKAGRQGEPDISPGIEKRKHPRWEFPGMVEYCPIDSDGSQNWFGICRNLSLSGLGMICEDPLESGTELEIAIHQPEASMVGNATVRHCIETPRGYFVGVEFNFED